ncbi:MAG: hypothetical protein QXS42_06975 [Zestosphaera sp.]
MSITQIFFLSVYVFVMAAVGYSAIKYVGVESAMVREFKISVKARLARIVSIYKLSLLILRKPSTYLILAAVVASVIISGFNTRYENNLVVVQDRSIGNEFYDLMVRFETPVNADACSAILERAGADVQCLKFYRVILDPPYTLERSRKLIYVLVGVEDTVLKSLGIERGLQDRVFLYSEAGSEFVADFLKVDDISYEVLLIRVNGDMLRNYLIFYRTPLIPIQGYVGTEPITVPLQHVLITSLRNAVRTCGSGRELVTDVVVRRVSRFVDPSELYSLLEPQYPVSEVAVVGNGVAYFLSDVRVPTAESVVSAVISSVTASVIIISVFSSTVPYLRELRDKISYMGFQPWAITVIVVGYTIMSILTPGLASLTYVFASMGGAATLNSMVALLLAWVVSTVYMGLKVRPERLATEAFMPPTARYVLITPVADVSRLCEVIADLIKANEFFYVEEIEWRVEGGEAFVHAKMDYVDSWGSGVDLAIFINPGEGGTHITINSMVFGVEEISETMSRSINALAVSKVIGGVKAWEATYS